MNIEQKRKLIVVGGSVIAVGVVGFVVAPVIYIAVKGIFGLALAGVVGAGAVFGAPVLLDKFANWKLKAIKTEAAENPIETFENEYILQAKEAATVGNELKVFLAEVASYEDSYESFKVDATELEKRRYEQEIEAYKKIAARRERMYSNMLIDLEAFAKEIQKAKRSYSMALKSLHMRAVADKQFDPMRQIKKDTAIEAVRTKVNTAFAEMRVEMIRDKETALLEFMPSNVIEGTSLRIEQKVLA